MSLFFGFLLLGGIWALMVSAGWYGITYVAVVRRAYPQARRSALSALAGSVLFLSFTAGTTLLMRETPALVTPEGPMLSNVTAGTLIPANVTPGNEVETVTVSLSTDPPDAAVFLGDVFIGHSPVELQLSKETSVPYLIIASPERFRPFAGRLDASETMNLAVWIDRRNPQEVAPLTSSETEAWLITEMSPPLKDDPAISGTIRNTSDKHFPYVVLSYLLYDQDDHLLGSSYAVVHELEPGEEQSFVTTPVAEGTAVYRLFEVTGLNP